jgi:hypothetical protein
VNYRVQGAVAYSKSGEKHFTQVPADYFESEGPAQEVADRFAERFAGHDLPSEGTVTVAVTPFQGPAAFFTYFNVDGILTLRRIDGIVVEPDVCPICEEEDCEVVRPDCCDVDRHKCETQWFPYEGVRTCAGGGCSPWPNQWRKR